jgi:hypothetical protein
VAAEAPALLLVKCPANPAEEAFLEVAARIARERPAMVRVVAVEPHLDRAIAARFPRLEMITDFAALLAACAGARLVVSARFHGCIAGIMAGAPTAAVGPRKCGDLMELLGVPEAHLPPEAVEDLVFARRPPVPVADAARLVPGIRAAAAEMRARLVARGIVDQGERGKGER